jgi:hypothetical protein
MADGVAHHGHAAQHEEGAGQGAGRGDHGGNQLDLDLGCSW